MAELLYLGGAFLQPHPTFRLCVNIPPQTRATLTYLAGLGILLSQAVVGALGHSPSELLIGAGLMICIPETLRLLRGGGGDKE